MLIWSSFRNSTLNENSRVKIFNKEGTKMALNYFNANLSLRNNFVSQETCTIVSDNSLKECTLYKNEENIYVLLPKNNAPGSFRYCILDEEELNNLVKNYIYFSDTRNNIKCDSLKSRVVKVKDNTSKEWNVFDCYESIIYDLKNIESWIDDRKEIFVLDDLFKLENEKYSKVDCNIYKTDFFYIFNNNIYHKNLFDIKDILRLNGLKNLTSIVHDCESKIDALPEESLSSLKYLFISRDKYMCAILETETNIKLIKSKVRYANNNDVKNNLKNLFSRLEPEVILNLNKNEFDEKLLEKVLEEFEKITKNFLNVNNYRTLESYLEEIKNDDIFNLFAV